MTQPWQYTSFLDLIDHWQALIAGILGFVAAIVVVAITLRIERRKLDRELDALRKSLAVELRHLVSRSLGANISLLKWSRHGQPITARMVESLSRVPSPIVYQASADKIGLLEKDAMDIVIVYALIELGRSGVAALINSRDPDNISPATVEATAKTFLKACIYAQSVLPRLKTGVAHHDEQDAKLIDLIKKEGEAQGVTNQSSLSFFTGVGQTAS